MNTATWANRTDSTMQKQPVYKGIVQGVLCKTSKRFDEKWKKKYWGKI